MAGGVDVATLGLRVDASEVRDATGALGNLQRQGERTEQTTKRLETGARSMGRGMGTVATQLERTIIQTTGLNAGLVRMGSTLLMFAAGGTVLVGVLAGLAAIAAAWRKMGEAAREAREELVKQRAVLTDLLAARDLAARGGPSLVGLDALQAHGRGLAERIAGLGNDPASVAGRLLLERQLAANNELVRNGRAALIAEGGTGEDFGTRGVNKGGSSDAIVKASQAAAAASLAAAQELQRKQFEILLAGKEAREALLAEELEERVTTARKLKDGVIEQERLLREESVKLAREKSAELRRAADRARDERIADNASLALSLENLGRAFGGTADRVFALGAAVLRLENEKGDPLIRGSGIATGALGGFAIGASSGSGAGLFGGAAAGLASGGPAGAIVGAVSGIVGGLIESGRRAEEARRIWQRAFEDFARMFDPLTPTEQITRTFEDLVDALGFINNAADRQSLAELTAAYSNNLAVAQALADAEEDLYDARFRALNAPSGLNLQRYGYQAGGIDWGAIGVPDGKDKDGGTINVQGDVNINVDGSGDPDATAKAVLSAIKRQSKRGGPQPFNPRTR